VPKAAVNEDDDTLLAEAEIRGSQHTDMPAPSGDPQRSHHLEEGDFGAPVVLAPDSGHHSRSLRGAENVRHFRSVQRATEVTEPYKASICFEEMRNWLLRLEVGRVEAFSNLMPGS
jgi:hypothetical protein